MKKLSLTILAIALLTTLVFSQEFKQKVSNSKIDSNNKLPAMYATIASPISEPTIGKSPSFNYSFGSDNSKTGTSSMQSQLSTLWVAVTLNMITADVLSLYIPECMEDWEKTADGKESEFMLGGAIMYQVPISMVFLSRMLPYKTNRWTNIIAAGLMSAAVVVGGENEPHYIVCAAAEIGCMSLIALKALKWKNPEDSKHDLGLNLNP